MTATAAAIGSTPPSDVERRVSARFMAIYAFAQFSAWLAILTPIVVTLALRVGEISSPEDKAGDLSLVLALGAFFAMVAAPIWGAISDNTTARIGRRKLWIALGALFLLCGLTIMALSTSIIGLGIGWLVCQTGSNATQASLNAILPDQVPLSQRGRMSSILGLTIIVATVAGSFITQFTQSSSIAMFLVPWLPSVLSVALVLKFLPDAPAPHGAPISLGGILSVFRVNPFKDREFGLVFSSRFLVATGYSFAQTYQVFALTDMVGVPTAEVPRAIFISSSAVAVLGLILTPIAGYVVDRTRRMKPVVVLSGLVVATGLLLISQVWTLALFIGAVTIIKVAKNVFTAITMAVSASVLPTKASAAKDLGIMQIANSLPQSLAPAIAPLFLAIGGGQSNYPAMFLAATAFALVGSVMILPLRRVA